MSDTQEESMPVTEHQVRPDEFRVARESVLLSSYLSSAMAVCVHDDTQGVGGMLHLRYVASEDDKPLELTDNTLSSDLLLLDRFCKELRSLGARKHSWKVQILAHTTSEVDVAAATVLDLVQAYFSDSRLPVDTRELSRAEGIVVRMDPREGRFWVHGADAAAAHTASAGVSG
jgi:chemotaxis receptor (MCP) glutamine deamidase CheD